MIKKRLIFLISLMLSGCSEVISGNEESGVPRIANVQFNIDESFSGTIGDFARGIKIEWEVNNPPENEAYSFDEAPLTEFDIKNAQPSKEFEILSENKRKFWGPSFHGLIEKWQEGKPTNYILSLWDSKQTQSGIITTKTLVAQYEISFTKPSYEQTKFQDDYTLATTWKQNDYAQSCGPNVFLVGGKFEFTNLPFEYKLFSDKESEKYAKWEPMDADNEDYRNSWRAEGLQLYGTLTYACYKKSGQPVELTLILRNSVDEFRTTFKTFSGEPGVRIKPAPNNESNSFVGCTSPLKVTENSASDIDCGYFQVEVIQSDLNTGECTFLGEWKDRNGSTRTGLFNYCGAFTAGSAKEDSLYTLYVEVVGPVDYTTVLGVSKRVLEFSVLGQK